MFRREPPKQLKGGKIMSNYKWITYFKEGTQRVFLVDEDFKRFSFPAFREIDDVLKEKLREHGIHISLEYTKDWEPYFRLLPLNIQNITVVAPVYKKEDNGYVQVLNSYAATVVNPEQYEWIRQEIKKCQQEVKEEQAKKFVELFNKKTLDGLTACITINSNYIGNDFYSDRYVPKGYIEICHRCYRDSPNYKNVIFIKEVDLHGANVQIKIPEKYKVLVIGRSAKNIKRIEKRIHAGKIIVIEQKNRMS